MSGALKVGDVFVAVSASLSEFSKGVDKLLKDVEEAADAIGKAMQEAADAIGGFSENLLAVSAVAGAAVAAAAEHCAEAQRAGDALKDSVSQLAVEVGRTFLPLVRELTQVVRTLTATWRGLSADAKASIIAFVRNAAVLGTVGMATSRLMLVFKSLADGTVVLTKAARAVGPALAGNLAAIAKSAGGALTYFNAFVRAPIGYHIHHMSEGLASLRGRISTLPDMARQLSSSFASVLPKIAAVTLPVLVLAAAVAGLALLAGSLYDAWNDTSTGLKDSVENMGTSIVGLASDIRDALLGVFESTKNFAVGLISTLIEALTVRVRSIAKFGESVARFLGRNTLADNFALAQNLTATGVAKYIDEKMEETAEAAKKALAAPIDAFLSARDGVIDGVRFGVKRSTVGLSAILRDSGLADFPDRLMAELKKLLPTIGDPNTVEDVPAFDREPSAVGKADFEKLRELGRRGTTLYQEAFNEHARVLRDAAKEHARVLAEAVESARQSLVAQFTSRLGNLQGVIQSAQQGAQAGGAWGAVAAVVLELLTQSEGFAAVIEMVNAILQQVANVLGQVLAPLQGLLGAVSRVLDAALRPLAPLFSMLAGTLEPFAPALVIIGDMLSALGPFLELVVQGFSVLLNPLSLLGGPIMTALFEAFRWVSLIIMSVVWGLYQAWNAIVSAVQWVLRALGDISIFGAKPLAFLSDWADSLQSAKAPVEDLEKSMRDLRDMTLEQAKAKANETAATVKNTKALQEATESLTNVPAAWRVAQRRFEAQDARTSPLLPAGLAPSTTQSAPAQAAAQGISIHTINVSGEDTGRALAKLEQHLNNLSFRRRGTTASPGRYAMEGG
ncbi:hypothetical protein CYFUS_006609 [Cystobacter fuscus]|uniref:Uncharacterized protein n=1 Tax=Cystobacter fuscus TaxID=43 RepID=A0A250JCA1_9BACT|nr:hypothetical protein [Cystobacter fuscus]ATB41147.1 hypothetical protein CYFUS_006609 [Cystobacter fuscus]